MICMLKKKSIYPGYVSKLKSKCEKQGIILMTPKGEQWHYLGGNKIICIIMRNIVKT